MEQIQTDTSIKYSQFGNSDFGLRCLPPSKLSVSDPGALHDCPTTDEPAQALAFDVWADDGCQPLRELGCLQV